MAPLTVLFPRPVSALASLPSPGAPAPRHSPVSRPACGCKGIRRCLQCHSSAVAAHLLSSEKNLTDNGKEARAVSSPDLPDLFPSGSLDYGNNGAAYLQWQHRADCPQRPAKALLCQQPRYDVEKNLLPTLWAEGRASSTEQCRQGYLFDSNEGLSLLVRSEPHAERSRATGSDFSSPRTVAHSVRTVVSSIDCKTSSESDFVRGRNDRTYQTVTWSDPGRSDCSSVLNGADATREGSSRGWAVRARRFLTDAHPTCPRCWEDGASTQPFASQERCSVAGEKQRRNESHEEQYEGTQVRLSVEANQRIPQDTLRRQPREHGNLPRLRQKGLGVSEGAVEAVGKSPFVGEGLSRVIKAIPAAAGDLRRGKPHALTLYFVWCPDCRRLHRQVAEPSRDDCHIPESRETGGRQAEAGRRDAGERKEEKGPQDGPIQKRRTSHLEMTSDTTARTHYTGSQRCTGTCQILRRFCLVEEKCDDGDTSEAGEWPQACGGVETRESFVPHRECVEAEAGQERAERENREPCKRETELHQGKVTSGVRVTTGENESKGGDFQWPLLNIEVARAVCEALLGSWEGESEDQEVANGAAEDEYSGQRRAHLGNGEEECKKEEERAVASPGKIHSQHSEVPHSGVTTSVLAVEVVEKLLHLMGLTQGRESSSKGRDAAGLGGPGLQELPRREHVSGNSARESPGENSPITDDNTPGERVIGHSDAPRKHQEEETKRWFDSMFGVVVFPDALSETAEGEILAWADGSCMERRKTSNVKGMLTGNSTPAPEEKRAPVRTEGAKVDGMGLESSVNSGGSVFSGENKGGNNKENKQKGREDVQERERTSESEKELSDSKKHHTNNSADTTQNSGGDAAYERRASAEGSEEQEGVEEEIDEEDGHHSYWSDSQSGRRKIEFGAQVNFKKKKVRLGKFTGLPAFYNHLRTGLSDSECASSSSLVGPAFQGDSSSIASHSSHLEKPVRPSRDFLLNSGLCTSSPVSESSVSPGSHSPVWPSRLLKNFRPVDLCLLDYSPSRGSHIEEHFDDEWLWGPRLVTYNLLSETFLSFVSPVFCVPYEVIHKHKRSPCSAQLLSRPSSTATSESVNSFLCPDSLVRIRVEVRFLLPRRSLVVFQGPSRYTWTHAIRAHHIQRRRVAVTLRELSSAFLPGGEHHEVGQALLDIARSVSWKPIHGRGGERQPSDGPATKKKQGIVRGPPGLCNVP
ncbi:alpha-ketoglutarate-dependent dioxygenase alkb [Cystoisospora suis]|uniref:Alpha-ketoglutarate-dependent dioxygenase alkb n=1 Tax=Cystoisospora suis TaxID=483139 RepID=A0A2C6LBK7_9APIC|nr:alpha-ketoglutarate-dependent dioxygenase alkb [Cystoisospora suis]